MFNKVLDKIKPTKKEEHEVTIKVNEFLVKVNSKLINAKAIVGGSFAKGTWLSGQHDIDVFVLFNKRDNMSLRLEVVVKSLFEKYEKIHGSRDYFIINYKGLSCELVPVFNIDKPEQAENITDVSPMHVDWVKTHSDSRLKDEIRLAKYFMRMNGCYGAETYVGGFSGYLVELLVIYYKGFMNFINNASRWRHGMTIDIKEEGNFVSEQKFPLIVIDPVQPNRNAAAALRHDKFDLFVELSKKFIVKQSLMFFKEKKIDLKKYDLVFKVEPLDGNKDVVGTKMLKAFELIKNELKKYDFNLLDSGWFWSDYGYFYFKLKSKKLSKDKKHYGPPIKLIQYASRFKQKYKKHKIGEENGKLFVIVPRQFIKMSEFAKFIITNEDVKDRVKSISITKK